MVTQRLLDLLEAGRATDGFDPGWVRTDMGGPQAPLTPERSVAGMMRVIDGLTMRDCGRFLTWEGAAAPW